ncbi:hypothetical protein EB821_05405 [Candidatus Marinimicrobia bacterium PRS2]|nr:hypothetical protein EB821_05405 [Candidatus Marinimicrobia bacterium PRS2]
MKDIKSYVILVSSLILSYQCVSNADNNKEWVGTYNGMCPSYNMKNKYGEDMIIFDNYVSIPAVQFTFEIYDNNMCTIYMQYGEKNIICPNVEYIVSSNSNNFSLTMSSKTGNDCGEVDFVLIKNENHFKIAKGTRGTPSFIVKKPN